MNGSVRSDVASFWDELSDVYDPEGVEFFRPIARRLVELAEIRVGSRVLDVGCGRGAVVAAAADVVGPGGHVLGIDISERMVEQTKALAQERGLVQADAVVADGEAPPVSAGSLDAVLSSMAIFLVPDAAAALRGYALALCPGGRLAFSTFGTGDVWERIEKAVRSFVPDLQRRDHEHAWFATPVGIRALVEGNGFRSVEIHDESQPVAFASAEAWYEWTFSTPFRRLWRAVPESDAVAARAAAVAKLPPPDAEGRLILDTAVRYTRAEPVA
ncbi:MAG TPA: methyltransferase domain-containing protein [Gaiellaceae bacterium]|nr:methyltransferase domain-containing protein [Gaiellaceae bacterium]